MNVSLYLTRAQRYTLASKYQSGVLLGKGVVVILSATVCLSSCAINNDELGLKGQPRMESATAMHPQPDTSFVGYRTYKQQNIEQSVFFAHDKSTFEPETYAIMLNSIVTFLNDNSNAGVQIQGNASETGSNRYNVNLSAKRAAAVKVYLIKLGVSPYQLTTVSYGNAKPVYTDPAKNRRVDVVYSNSVYPVNYQLSGNKIPDLVNENVTLTTYGVCDDCE